MFANNSSGVMNMCIAPDVCKTPPLGEPLPYPNMTYSFFHIPAVFNLLFGDGLAENLMTQGTISLGDQPGVMGGVVSQIFMGPDRYLAGSFKVLVGGIFAMRLTSLVGMNGMPFNTGGMSVLPAQFRVLLLG